MVIKRKTTTRIIKGADDSAAASKNVEMDMEKHTEEEGQEEPTVDVEEENQEQESEEDKLARIEDETVRSRKKELKSMAVGDVKALLASNGLDAEHMKKEKMIDAMLAHESKARQAIRAKQAKMREVIVNKKAELEALSISNLSKMCNAMNIQGVRAKPERIRLILESWQDDNGVEKALTQMARQERLMDLQGMEMKDLRMLCEANEIDPFVKEVMADRVVKAEKAAGRFDRPKLAKKEVPKEDKTGDLVDTLIANEASRKVAQKQKVEQEEATKAKMTELRGKSLEELKKLLKKHGAPSEGKKEALVEALYAIFLHEEAVNARKSELKAMVAADLKALVSEKSLDCGHSKEKMIEAVLEHEAKAREEAKAFHVKADEIAAAKKEQLEDKTAAELKDLCAAKSLAVGGGKDDKIARLVEQARVDGEIDTSVSDFISQQRKEALLGMSTSDLLTLCEKLHVDPCVKELLIERLLTFEDEKGVVAEPPTKKARKH